MFQHIFRIFRRRRSFPPRVPFEKNVVRSRIRFTLRSVVLLLFVTAIALAAIGPTVRQRVAERVAESNQEAVRRHYAKQLSALPYSFGDWVGTNIDYDSQWVASSRVDGYVFRTYRNSSGDEVDLFLACGKAYHMTIHTPGWFLGCSGNQVEGEIERTDLTLDDQGQKHEFRHGRFFNSRFYFNNMFWAYTSDGNWRSPKPERARRVFAHGTFLCKLYLMERCERTTDVDAQQSPAIAFAKQALPEINRVLGWTPVVSSQRTSVSVK